MQLTKSFFLATALVASGAGTAYAQDRALQSVAIVVQDVLPEYQGAEIKTYFFNSNTPAQVFTAFKAASGSEMIVFGNDKNNNGIFEAAEVTSVFSEKTGSIAVTRQSGTLKTALGKL